MNNNLFELFYRICKYIQLSDGFFLNMTTTFVFFDFFKNCPKCFRFCSMIIALFLIAPVQAQLQSSILDR